MADLITTEDFDLTAGANVIAGVLALSVFQLVKTNLAMDRNTTLADVTDATNKANYNTYADGVITWSAATRADDGAIEWIGTVPEFRPTDGVVPNDVFGGALINAAGTKLQAVCEFDGAPFPMRSVLDSLIVTLRYRPAGGSLVVTIS
jgi:hypothetical protein